MPDIQKIKSIIAGYIELTKPRILSLVLVTTALGYFLGGQGIASWEKLFILLGGVALVCGGSAALNHYLEREVDSKMDRTKNRPIPQGLIAAHNALSFGILLILTGVFILWGEINLLTAFLSLLTAFLYVLVYTPMKRISWINTSIGAIHGALPPMGGWAAATGELNLGAWILFLILYTWQHPHFYSIAWMYREDYRQAGFKMLPVVHPNGRSTFAQINFFAVLLIVVSLWPCFIGIAGRFYFWGALLAGIILLAQGLLLTASRSHADAHKLLRASVIYLPVLFLLIVLDVHF